MVKKKCLKQLQLLQTKCLKCISPDITKYLSVSNVITLENIKFGWKVINKELPPNLLKSATTDHKGSTLNKVHRYSTRNKTTPNMPFVRIPSYSKSIYCTGLHCYNELPKQIKEITNFKTFVAKGKQHILGTNG